MRGASKGEGLGNQFLANIREVDAVAYVLRCFEDADITHVEGRIDPLADAETVETELMLADLESLERRRDPLAKKAQGRRQGSQGPDRADRTRRWSCCAPASRPAWPSSSAEEEPAYRALQLLTAKPVLYVCNVDEASAAAGNAHVARRSRRRRGAEGAGCVVISAKIESRDRRAGARGARRDSWTTWACRSPASTG